jgi:subtilisin family serine protease
VEYAWRFTHEDLRLNKGGVIAGTPSAEVDYRNHGTAVIGILGADRNSIGVTGIAPDAMIRAAACNGGVGTSEAIVQAAGPLSVGDILVIELHRPGPQYGFALRNDQLGFIPIEWWPDDFAAIQYAVGIGIIVVAAGGNGAQNLDDSLYDVNPVSTPYGSFPPSWSKPFRRGSVDSGAILVGAGAPPPQTHGRSWGAARSRLDFSNYGSCIDAQGWGREATTTGYGDLQGGPDEDVWYTDQFAGTSSATPIVAGAMGCVQGNRRARKSGSLTPAEARLLLRSTGSAQDPASALQRIGNLPDLRQLLAGTPPVASLSRVVPTGPKTRASRKIPKPKKSAARSRKKKKAPGK